MSIKTNTIESDLIQTAIETLKNSHSPHSKFKVGAAVLTGKGNIYRGTNVEFDALSLTICAERAALFSSVSHGEKNITTVAIATNTEEFVFPCGLCRQALVEFNPKMKIILINKKGKMKRSMIKDILPNHFRL
jgi:cytidine deaminase